MEESDPEVTVSNRSHGSGIIRLIGCCERYPYAHANATFRRPVHSVDGKALSSQRNVLANAMLRIILW